ncbi:MAG: IPT/TIG domain-containing protein [Dehalococcoidia bacterium]|nr:IPT/TIG domain-containing protein [Dehalococcoidia bacterium]
MTFRKILRHVTVAIVVGVLASTLFIASQVQAATTLTANPLVVAPGDKVTISGTGFQSPVTIQWTYGNVNISMTGNVFEVELEIPANITTVMQCEVIATDIYSTSDKTSFFVVPRNYALSSNSGFVGDPITITGDGFSANQEVTLLWDGLFLKSFIVSSTGAIPNGTTFLVPHAEKGNHTISLKDMNAATRNFVVNPRINIDPISGGVGDIIAITGTGFTKTASININIDGFALTGPTTPSTIYVDANGDFNAKFSVSPMTRGSHIVQASDGSGGIASTNLDIGAKIALTPSSAKIGESIAIVGTGFQPNEEITIEVDGVLADINPFVTDASGGFSLLSVTVPPSWGGGVHEVTASDGLYNASDNLAIVPQIIVGMFSSTVGSKVPITGNGFAPNATITFFWDGVAETTTTVSSIGAFSIDFVVPNSYVGGHMVRVADDNNYAEDYLSVVPRITASPNTGRFDDSIIIGFSGFAPNSAIKEVLLISINGADEFVLVTNPVAIATDSNGSASASIRVAGVYCGDWYIKAEDINNNATTTTFTVISKLGVSNGTDSVFEASSTDQVVIVGTGLLRNSNISLTCNGLSVLTGTALKTDNYGSFIFQLELPENASAEAFEFVCSDGSNNASCAIVAVPKAITDKPTSQDGEYGYVGMEMTITGYSFVAGSTITLKFDATILGTVLSNTNGSFTALIKIPAAVAGKHSIGVDDGTNSLDIDFFMDSVAPSIASLSSPVAFGKTEQQVTFNWTAVSDDSGVVYRLQISKDINFTYLLLDTTGISTNKYKLDATEKLVNTDIEEPYYWRVMAIDLAGNEGLWSEAAAFTVGTGFPPWLIIILWVVGGVIALGGILVVGLWIGRRMAYRAY